MSPRTSVDALWVAALVSEVAPLVRLLEQPRLLSHRLCVGRLGDRRIAVLRCGVGPERAERRTREALARLEASTVWSLGSCGALVDDLSVGEVVTADAAMGLGRRWELPPVDGLRRGTVLTVDTPIFDADRRAAAADLGALVCEMEAAAVVTCHPRVRVLKVVSDRAGAEPDVVFARPRALAVARFHRRVERIMREALLPVLRQA